MPASVLLSASACGLLALFCLALTGPSARRSPGSPALLALLLLMTALVARSMARGLGLTLPPTMTLLALGGFALLPPLAALYARGGLGGAALYRRDAVHALPAVLLVVGLAALGGEMGMAAWQSYGVGLQLLAVAYGVWTWRLWRASERPRWTGGVLAAFAVHWTFSAAAWAASLVPGVPASVGPPAEAASMLALLVFGGSAVVGALRRHPALAPPAPAPYARAGLAETQRQTLAAKLREVVREEKPHLDPELTASGLAEAVGATPRELSEVLTCEIGQGFFEYIAALRVEEAKARLADPEQADATILEIVYASGWGSKSAFHRAFREHVGETPSAYRRRVLGLGTAHGAHPTPARAA